MIWLISGLVATGSAAAILATAAFVALASCAPDDPCRDGACGPVDAGCAACAKYDYAGDVDGDGVTNEFDTCPLNAHADGCDPAQLTFDTAPHEPSNEAAFTDSATPDDPSLFAIAGLGALGTFQTTRTHTLVTFDGPPLVPAARGVIARGVAPDRLGFANGRITVDGVANQATSAALFARLDRAEQPVRTQAHLTVEAGSSLVVRVRGLSSGASGDAFDIVLAAQATSALDATPVTFTARVLARATPSSAAAAMESDRVRARANFGVDGPPRSGRFFLLSDRWLGTGEGHLAEFGLLVGATGGFGTLTLGPSCGVDVVAGPRALRDIRYFTDGRNARLQLVSSRTSLEDHGAVALDTLTAASHEGSSTDELSLTAGHAYTLRRDDGNCVHVFGLADEGPDLTDRRWFSWKRLSE